MPKAPGLLHLMPISVICDFRVRISETAESHYLGIQGVIPPGDNCGLLHPQTAEWACANLHALDTEPPILASAS